MGNAKQYLSLIIKTSQSANRYLNIALWNRWRNFCLKSANYQQYNRKVVLWINWRKVNKLSQCFVTFLWICAPTKWNGEILSDHPTKIESRIDYVIRKYKSEYGTKLKLD